MAHIFGTATTEGMSLNFTRKDLFFMIFQIIATHNPQDFFNGIEPEDLPEYYEATNENLTEIVLKCIEGGYTVIIYKKEN